MLRSSATYALLSIDGDVGVLIAFLKQEFVYLEIIRN
jgi:hypothetical protein